MYEVNAMLSTVNCETAWPLGELKRAIILKIRMLKLSNFDHLQRFVRNRMVRVTLAVTLIALSVWAFAPYVGYRISSSAFVNAELVRVAAPIAGRLTRNLPSKGDFIERAVSVTIIEELSRDQRHLLDLASRHVVAKERAEMARKQLAEIAATDAELVKTTKIYRDGMIARLGHERDETKAERTGCLAEASQRRDVGSRMERLVTAGLATPIRTAEVTALLEATSTRCEMADAKLQRLSAELVSAKDGVVLGDGANDVPYSQQQRDRLQLRRQELETKELEERLQSLQISSELTEERERLNRISHFDLLLPADHLIWSVAASPGSTVTVGQNLLDLAACERRFVVVELPEGQFEKIKAGAPAFVRLIGSDDWKQGKIWQVRGSAARADDRLLAAQVQKPEPHSITVEIGLPQDDVQSERNSFCNIGRLAEVRFQRSGFALFAGWGRKLQQLVGYSAPAVNQASIK
jgi:multidrug resistance efflux pump